MRRKTRYVLVGIAVAVALAAGAFIFSNSAQAADASWRGSNAVADLVRPVLEGTYGAFRDACSNAGAPTMLTYEAFVRKVAHVVEYGLLGVACCAATVALVGRASSPFIWTDLFIVLATAVLDEFVQSFVGRTSSVADVLVDFAGALVGIGIVVAVSSFAMRKTRGTGEVVQE